MVEQLVGNSGEYSVVLSVASWAASTADSSAGWMDDMTVVSTARSTVGETAALLEFHSAEQWAWWMVERKVV